MQNRARMRKVYCGAAIAVLFFLMLLHRPTVQETARQNSIQTANLGEVDLGGSITRFVLASFRGPLICGLWWEARTAQQKHEYEQMELVIRALSKLQPHYRGPWRYEAWNLAYNVAVEFDSVADKYFFIARGIRWLVEGERINRGTYWDSLSQQLVKVGDPDMREEVGVYTQDKFTFADEAQLFRILLQISCIPPERRDLTRLKNDPQELKNFKSQYPQFVRKIRDFRFVPEGAEKHLNDEILALLARHQDQPGLYPNRSDAAKGRSQPEHPFPFWPEDETTGRTRPANPGLELNQDCHEIARHWYEFSIEPLPATQAELTAGTVTRSQALTRNASTKQSIIFRANPARVKSLYAKHLEKEGWGALGQEAWKSAHEMWTKFGLQNGLDVPESEARDLVARSALYARRYPLLAQENKPPPQYLAQEDPSLYRELSDSYQAFLRTKYLTNLRQTANYGYWSVASDFNRRDERREAMQRWYDAGRRRSDLMEAIGMYDQSMAWWRPLLSTRLPLPPESEATVRVAAAMGPSLVPLAALPQLTLDSPTPYISNSQVQEEFAALNEEYLAAYALAKGPGVLKAYLIATETASLLARQAGSPGGQFGAAGGLPMGVTPLTIEDAEDVAELSAGPFDRFLSMTIVESRASRDKLYRRAKLDGSAGKVQPAEAPSGGPSAVPAPPNSSIPKKF